MEGLLSRETGVPYRFRPRRPRRQPRWPRPVGRSTSAGRRPPGAVASVLKGRTVMQRPAIRSASHFVGARTPRDRYRHDKSGADTWISSSECGPTGTSMSRHGSRLWRRSARPSGGRQWRRRSACAPGSAPAPHSVERTDSMHIKGAGGRFSPRSGMPPDYAPTPAGHQPVPSMFMVQPENSSREIQGHLLLWLTFYFGRCPLILERLRGRLAKFRQKKKLQNFKPDSREQSHAC